MKKSIISLMMLPLTFSALSTFAENQSHDLARIFSPAKIQALMDSHSNAPYQWCSKKSDEEYQKLIIGRWNLVKGSIYDEFKPKGLELRYTFNDDNTVIMNIGDINNKWKNIYEAKGTYAISQGMIYHEYTSESKNIGMINKPFYEEINCMDKNKLEWNGEWTFNRI